MSAWKEPVGRKVRRWTKAHKTAMTASIVAILAVLIGSTCVLAEQKQATLEVLETKNAF